MCDIQNCGEEDIRFFGVVGQLLQASEYISGVFPTAEQAQRKQLILTACNTTLFTQHLQSITPTRNIEIFLTSDHAEPFCGHTRRVSRGLW